MGVIDICRDTNKAASSHKQSSRLNAMAKSVQSAFYNSRFYLKAQPIVSVAKLPTEHLLYEVLLGIKEPEFCDLSTIEIVSFLEGCNKTIWLDKFVIERLSSYLNSSNVMSCDRRRFSVNLSGETLSNNPFFVRELLDSMGRGDFPAKRVCFELTEMTCLQNLTSVSEFIESARAHGCQFALDDFGAGYTSYAYLTSLPVDMIKISGTYIKQMEVDNKVRSVVKSLIYLADDLDVSVVAMCIENSSQYGLAEALGVDYVQGWYPGRPVPLDELN